jgi:SAM-dependent methyltransferase
MPVVSTCPVCQGSQCFVFIDGVDEDLTLASVGSSRTKLSHGRILRCKDCSFAFRQFRPNDEELEQLYRDADAKAYESEAANRARAAVSLNRIVVRRRPDAGSILDIGCASGLFLKSMADRGWTSWGVEPSAVQFALAKEALNGRAVLQNTTLEGAELPGAFDVITAWDVVEHVTDPTSFLSRCAALLKPDGFLFLTVPDMDSWQARVLKHRWPMLLAEHLNYFNRPSLRMCCKRAGLHLRETDRRAYIFSVDYVFYRLGQHQLPGMPTLRKTVAALGLQRLPIPVYIGETVAICRRK